MPPPESSDVEGIQQRAQNKWINGTTRSTGILGLGLKE